MAFDERADDGTGTMNFPDDDCKVDQGKRLVSVRMRDADIFVYYHQPTEGEPYLVIDVDTDTDEEFPLRIYRNDGLVHEENL